MKRLTAILLVLAMLLGLTACGSSSEEASASAQASASQEASVQEASVPEGTGYYLIESMEEDGETYDKELLSALGADVFYLILSADGTAQMYLFDEVLDNLTWTPGQIGADGDSIPYTLADGTLTIDLEGTVLTYKFVSQDPPAELPVLEDTGDYEEDYEEDYEDWDDSMYEDETEEEPTMDAPAAVEGSGCVDTQLFTLYYDEADGWTYEEDDVGNYESYCSLYIEIPDDDGYYKTKAHIYSSTGDCYEFRSELRYLGFDQYEYAVNNAYPFVEVGGVDMLCNDDSSSDIYYIGWNESAGQYFYVNIYGDLEDGKAAALLEGLTFNYTDIGHEDGPWYWEGTPYEGEDKSTMIGTYTLSGQWLPFEEPVISWETFDNAIAVVGESVYVLEGGVLREYAQTDTAFTYVGDIDLPEDDYDTMMAADDGTLMLSAFLDDYIGIKDGSQVFAYDGPDYLAMHPSGAWGISYFSSNETEIYSFDGGAMTTETFVFPEVSDIRKINITDNHILISGQDAETGNVTMYAYDLDGNLELTMQDSDGSLGSLTFMCETANGYLALDANMREILLWNTDGQFIGKCDDDDVFGTDYPWFCDAQVLSDGSIIVLMTQERDDESCDEIIAYLLTGF